MELSSKLGTVERAPICRVYAYATLMMGCLVTIEKTCTSQLRKLLVVKLNLALHRKQT